MTISWTSLSLSVLGPRSRSQWLFLEKHCHRSSALIYYPISIRPEFFYFLVLGSADPNFWKSRIKIKLGSKSFIFILSADRLMPSTNKIKARTIFEGNQVRLH